MRKSLLRLISVILLSFSLNSNAQEFIIDGVYYYSSDGQTVTVGEAEYSGDITIPATVTFEGDNYTVTEIAEEAFRNRSELTSVNIKASITKLPSFYKCQNLKSVTLSSSINELATYTFSGCKNLQSVIGLENTAVTKIPEYAFNECASLATITFPGNISEIGEYAFYYCTSLTEIYLPATLKSFGSASFYNCTNLGKITIGAIEPEYGIPFDIFDGCSALSSLHIEDSESELICSGTIYSSCPLQEVYIGRNTQGLDFECFETLTKATFGNKVNYIQDRLFEGCYNLSSVTLPAAIDSICSGAFYGCSSLANIDIPATTKSIGDGAFSGCNSLTNIDIPAGCKTIGSSAFAECTGLTTISLPNIEVINRALFYGCTGLTSIVIPNSVKTIGQNAFFSCKKLNTVTLGSGVETIEDGAFYENNKLKHLHYHGNLESWLKIEMKANSYPEDTNPLCYADSLYFDASETEEGTFVSDLVIPADIDSIPAFAFTGYAGLKSLKTEGTLKNIGESAFAMCKKLTTADIDVEDIHKEAFMASGLTSLTLRKNLKSVGISAFYSYKNCNVTYTGTLYDWCHIDFKSSDCLPKNTLTVDGQQVTGMTLPTGISTIKPYTFSSTKSLTSLTVPATVKEIGNYAFSGCSALEEVTVKGVLTKIGNYAFANNDKLKTIRKVASAETRAANQSAESTEIGVGAFQNDALLETIELSNPIGNVGEYAFEGTAWLNNQSDGIVYIGNSAYVYKGEMPENTKIAIKEGITTICSGAFKDQTNLTEISLPQSIESIGDAFSGSGLKSLTIPQQVKRIGANIVSNCQSLTNFEISDGEGTLLVETEFLHDEPMCPASVTDIYIGRLVEVDIDGFKESNRSKFEKYAEILRPNNPGLSDEELIDLVISNFVLPLSMFSSYEDYNIQSLSFGKNIVNIPSEINFADVVSPSITNIKCMSNTPPTLYLTDPKYNGYYIDQYPYWFNEEYEGALVNCTLSIPTGTTEAYAAADFWKEFLKVNTEDFTGIENTIDDSNAVEIERYDISGKQLSAPSKGINLIKMSNGKIKKVYIR